MAVAKKVPFKGKKSKSRAKFVRVGVSLSRADIEAARAVMSAYDIRTRTGAISFSLKLVARSVADGRLDGGYAELVARAKEIPL